MTPEQTRELRDGVLDAVDRLGSREGGTMQLAEVAAALVGLGVIGHGPTIAVQHAVLDAVDTLVARGVVAWGARLAANGTHDPASGWPWLRVTPKGQASLAKHRAMRERERRAEAAAKERA